MVIFVERLAVQKRLTFIHARIALYDLISIELELQALRHDGRIVKRLHHAAIEEVAHALLVASLQVEVLNKWSCFDLCPAEALERHSGVVEAVDLICL